MLDPIDALCIFSNFLLTAVLIQIRFSLLLFSTTDQHCFSLAQWIFTDFETAVIYWLTVAKSTKGFDLRGCGPTESNTAIWINIDFILYILYIKIYLHTALLYSGGPYGRGDMYISLSASNMRISSRKFLCCFFFLFCQELNLRTNYW